MISAVIVRFGNMYGEFKEYLIPLKTALSALHLALDDFVRGTKTILRQDLVCYEALSPVPYNCIDMFSFYNKPIKLYGVSTDYYPDCKIQDVPAYFITNSKRSRRLRLSSGNMVRELIKWLDEYKTMDGIIDLHKYNTVYENTALLLPHDLPGDVITSYLANASLLGVKILFSDDLHFVRRIKGDFTNVTVTWSSGTFIFNASIEDVYGSILYAIYQQCVTAVSDSAPMELNHDKTYDGLVDVIRNSVSVTVTGDTLDNAQRERLHKYINTVNIV